MSRMSLTRWTCDSCGAKEERPHTSSGAPTGWGGIATNMVAADGSWDHVDWHRFHICHTCRCALMNGTAWTRLPDLRKIVWVGHDDSPIVARVTDSGGGGIDLLVDPDTTMTYPEVGSVVLLQLGPS